MSHYCTFTKSFSLNNGKYLITSMKHGQYGFGGDQARTARISLGSRSYSINLENAYPGGGGNDGRFTSKMYEYPVASCTSTANSCRNQVCTGSRKWGVNADYVEFTGNSFTVTFSGHYSYSHCEGGCGHIGYDGFELYGCKIS